MNISHKFFAALQQSEMKLRSPLVTRSENNTSYQYHDLGSPIKWANEINFIPVMDRQLSSSVV